MTKKSPRQTARPSDDGSRAGADTSEHLEQVRAILFGDQFTAVDDRLKRLEQRLVDEQAAFRDATTQRFDALLARMDEQVSAMRQTVADGGARHEKAMADLAGELERSVTATEERLAQMRQDADQLAGELRRHTAERVEALAAQLSDQSSALSALVDEKLEELRSLKTDRESLAALFEEMAAKLKRRPSG